MTAKPRKTKEEAGPSPIRASRVWAQDDTSSKGKKAKARKQRQERSFVAALLRMTPKRADSGSTGRRPTLTRLRVGHPQRLRRRSYAPHKKEQLRSASLQDDTRKREAQAKWRKARREGSGPWAIFYHDNNELTGNLEKRKTFFVSLELCRWFGVIPSLLT